MKIGAWIVTTGLPSISGVTALLPEVGAISTVQCVDVSPVGLVAGPEEKKSGRWLAQKGFIFFTLPGRYRLFRGLQEGLSFMRGKFDRQEGTDRAAQQTTFPSGNG